MKDKNLVVQVIPKSYIGDDCIQIMIPFSSSIILLEKELSLEFEHVKCQYLIDKMNRDTTLNKYLEDERRNKFPYSNIPLHVTHKGFRKIYNVNQLLDLDKDYYAIVNGSSYCGEDGCRHYLGYIMHLYLLRDNEDVLLVSKYYSLDDYDISYDSMVEFQKRKYTLEEIKGLMPTRICASKEPKINTIFNSNIKKKEIEKAKKMVRTLNK